MIKPSAEVGDKKVLHNFINECLRLSIETKLFTKDDLIYESLTILTAVSVLS